MSIDPNYIIQGATPKILCTPFVLSTGNAQLLVTCRAGERIRVMGWIAQSVAAAVGSLTLKSATAGALMAPLFVPPITAGLCDRQPNIDNGYFETVTGENLTCDIATAGINLTLFYIQYKVV